MNTPRLRPVARLFDEVELEPSLRAQHLDALPPGCAQLDAMLEADIDRTSRPRGSASAELAGGSPAFRHPPRRRQLHRSVRDRRPARRRVFRRCCMHAAKSPARPRTWRSSCGAACAAPKHATSSAASKQALLRLHHPNIARMIEGGVTDDGQPYIALEQVDGSDIIEHARARRRVSCAHACGCSSSRARPSTLRTAR